MIIAKDTIIEQLKRCSDLYNCMNPSENEIEITEIELTTSYASVDFIWRNYRNDVKYFSLVINQSTETISLMEL